MEYLEAGKSLLKEIKDAGYDAYIVGGSVRDYLLNLEINDIDISTSMPLEMLETKYETSNTGGKYLSITIFYAGYSFEVTNFREDIEYFSNRFPVVKLVDDFKTDTIRRDFTINAMAIDSDGNLIDYHNGQEDLKHKLIRCIGEPDKRFTEDALRILRALYFQSKLDFEIEDKTLKSIIKNKELLRHLSDERIWYSLTKLYKCPNNRGIKTIKKHDLFEYIPDYKRVLDFVKKEYEHTDINVIYYFKYHEYMPLTTADEKKIINKFIDLVDNDFSKYSIYKNQDVFKYENIFKGLGYDYKKLLDIKNKLIIKKDNELALSKGEISVYLIPQKRNKFIKYIITEILEGRIKNDKDVIIDEVVKWK